MTIPSWTTPAGFLFTATELASTSTSVVATGIGTTYKVISGALPNGLTLSSLGSISGTPQAVINVTTNKFVVRATNSSNVTDRTFIIDVQGRDDPVWSTAEGFLNVGINGEQYSLNNQWVDYQLSATPIEAPTGTTLTYFIANNDGKLPPGLTLAKTGRITGFIKDKLGYDSGVSDTGGYDDEGYDTYSYDHAAVAPSINEEDIITGFPKVYQFRVTATDGINNKKGLFKIMVSSVEILLDNPTSMTDAGVTIPSPVSYVQQMQWLNGSNLGTIRASNNHEIPVTVYDPAPNIGTITYSIVTGTTVLTNLPEGLELEPNAGYIYGTVPYQPAYTRNYVITVTATKTAATSAITTNTFTLSVKGEVESTIEWVSTSSLGTIETGITSELAVVARQVDSDYSIKYALTSGTLPPGLTLERDGSLSGQVTYGSTGTYTFNVLASDVYELSSIEQEFTVTSIETDTRDYTKIYFKPFFAKDKREVYRDFISNEFTFDPSLMYRYYDANFGVQHDIKVVLEFGIEKLNLADYVIALRENFYRKRFYFGDVKKAVAKDDTDTAVYEIVYIDVVDDMVNNQGISASSAIYNNNEIYYPGSIENMRRQLSLIQLDNGDSIGINEFNLPKFMRTPQAGDYKPPEYIRAIPLCYALPGQADKIISRIKLSGFNFKQLDFEVDRIIVQESLDNSTAKYLLLERQSLGNSIDADQYLFGPADWQFITLPNNTIDPLERE